MLPTQEPSSSPSKSNSKKPSQEPNTQPTKLPTQEPSSSPSKTDSKQPSQEPNTQTSANPTMLPTQEPSSSPSKSNSKEPSQGPNNQSSTEPTRLQSQEPSSDPSVEPSLLPSGDRSIEIIILCPEEKSATGLNTTVGDVKSAVEHLLFSLTNGTFIATLASNNTGVDIALSSIALSQPLDFKSEHFITQIEVQGALQTLVEAIDDIDEVRIGAFDKLASSLAGGSLLDFLVGEMDRIAILKEDYVNFLDSRSNETKATREHFTNKFRYVRTSMWGAILQIYVFYLSQSSSC